MSKFLPTIKFLTLVAMMAWTIAGPALSVAADSGIFKGACSGTTEGAVCGNEVTTDPLTGPNGLIGKVTQDVALFAGIAAVIIMIVGGFMYILSNGDSGKVSAAKNTILYAAVGLVVIAFAQTIIIFVIDRI